MGTPPQQGQLSIYADISPLYFPGAKSAALRSHAGVKFLVYRVDSPEDVSDPISIMFKLDLAGHAGARGGLGSAATPRTPGGS